MKLDIQVLNFIEISSPIKRKDVERMLLWLSNDDEYSYLIKTLKKENIDDVVENLIKENYIEDKNGLLFINRKKQRIWRKFLVKTMTENRRIYSLELDWFGKIFQEMAPNLLEQLEDRMSKEINKNSCIQYFTPVLNKFTQKISYKMRYFRIELSLTLMKTNFRINSRAAIPDIPKFDELELVTEPMTEIPNDRDIFSLIAAPNISANYFLFKLLESTIKELDSSAMLLLTLAEFRILRGEDQLE